MEKTWMNIRKPLLIKFDMNDLNYHPDMLSLEDKKKSLKNEFKTPGY